MELIELLLLTTRLATDEVHGQLAEAGYPDLRPAHAFAFQFLLRRDGATGVELAEFLGVTRQAASQMVDELERSGYVARKLDPTDARLRRIHLTDRGRVVLRLSAQLWTEQERAWSERIGPEAMAALRASLLAFITDRDGLTPPVRLRPTW